MPKEFEFSPDQLVDLENSGFAKNNLELKQLRTSEPSLASTIVYDKSTEARTTAYPIMDMGYSTFYNKSAFKKLGFDPLVDNYEKYAKESSNWDLMKDAYNSHMKLRGSEFSFFGFNPFYTQLDGEARARRFEEFSALGTAIGRDDLFAKSLNLYAQAGFTTSIMYSIAAEEIALAAATALTKGAAAPVAYARTVKNLGRLGKAFNIADKGYDAAKTIKATKTAIETLDGIKDVNKARGFFQNAKNISSKGADLMFPHLSQLARDIKKGEEGIQGFGALTKSFAAFYREGREFSLAHNEASLEKQFAEKQAMDSLIDKYREVNNGKNPEGEDLLNIQKIAQESGSATYLNNIGILYGSNKIGLGGIFNKYTGRVIGQTTSKSAAGKIVRTKADLSKGVKPKYDYLAKQPNVYKQFKQDFKHYTSKSTLRHAPGSVIRWGGQSLLMGTSEGLQEYFQEVIQDAELNIVNNQYLNGVRGDIFENYLESTKKFVSKEGAEVFASGFFMGMFAAPSRITTNLITSGIDKYGPKLYGKYKENENYKKEVQAKYQEQVNKMNDLSDLFFNQEEGMGTLNNHLSLINDSKALDEANETENPKSFYDVKNKLSSNYIQQLIDYNMHEDMIDFMKQIGNMSDSEISDYLKSNPEQNVSEEEILKFRENSNEIISEIKQQKRINDEVNRIYQNPYSFSTKEDDTTFGYSENMLYRGYEDAKRTIIQNKVLARKTLERKDSIMNQMYNAPLFKNNDVKLASNVLMPFFNDALLSVELDLLKSELEYLEIADLVLTKDQREDLNYKRERLQEFEDLESVRTELKEILFFEDLLQNNSKALNLENLELQEGMTVTLLTKAGGQGTIIEDKGDKVVVIRDGKKVTVSKDKVKIDASTVKDISNTEITERKNDINIRLVEKLRKILEVEADKNKTSINNEEFEKIIQSFLDYQTLDKDQKNLEIVAERLLNPGLFEEYVLHKAEINKRIYENREEIIKKSFEAKIENAQFQELLNTLFEKYNAYILEEDFEGLFVNKQIPNTFYDTANQLPINQNSERHFKIEKEIQEFLDKKWSLEEQAKTEETIVNVSEETTESVESLTPVQLNNRTFNSYPEELKKEITNLLNNKNKTLREISPEAIIADEQSLLDNDETFGSDVIPLIENYNNKIQKEPVAETVKQLVEIIEESETLPDLKIDENIPAVVESEIDESIVIETQESIPVVREEEIIEQPIINLTLEKFISDDYIINFLNSAEESNLKISIPYNLESSERIALMRALREQGLIGSDVETLSEIKGVRFSIAVPYGNKIKQFEFQIQDGKEYKKLDEYEKIKIDLYLNQRYKNKESYPENIKQWVDGSGKIQFWDIHYYGIKEKQEVQKINKNTTDWKLKAEQKLSATKGNKTLLEKEVRNLTNEAIRLVSEGEIELDISSFMDAVIKDVNSKIDVSHFQKGQKYLLKNEGNLEPEIITVLDITKDSIIFVKDKNNKMEEVSIKKENLEEQVLPYNETTIQDVSTEINIQEEEKEIINNSNESVIDMLNDQQLLEKIDSSLSNDDETLLNDFINNLGC